MYSPGGSGPRTAGLVAHRKQGRWVHYRRAAHPGNPYAPVVLELLSASLGDDPIIAEDRRRLAYVNSIPVSDLIKAGPRLFEEERITAPGG